MYKRYAAIIAYSPSIGKEKVDEEIEKLQSIIKEMDGRIEKNEYLGLKPLAYSIKKYNTAHYVQFYFKIPKDKNTKFHISEINRKIGSKINPNTLRHMLMLLNHEDMHFDLKSFEGFDNNIKL